VLLLAFCIQCAFGADEWIVFKKAGLNSCNVQPPTANVVGGTVLPGGPYKTKAEATKAMCKNVDESATDSKKCWLVYPDDACKGTARKSETKQSPNK
jgi:hypothetical protein